MKKTILSFFTLLLVSFTIQAQKISFTGNVYGFLGEKVLLVRKASKNVSFEGPISGAKLFIKGKNGTITVITDITGSYSFLIPEKGDYVIEVLKDGYSSVNFNLKYNEAGAKSNFIATSFILKKEDNSVNALGDLLVDNSGKLEFTLNTSNQKKSSVDVLHSNKVLFEKTVLVNNSSKNDVGRKQAVTIIQPANTTNKNDAGVVKFLQQKLRDDSVTKEWSKSLLLTTSGLAIDSTSSIEEIKKEIEKSKEALLQLDPNSDNYALLLNQITNAENQLKVKETLITSQQEALSSAHKKMIYLSLFAMAAVGAIILLWQFLQQKKKFNLELDEKNKNISKINSKLVSSIRYASVIQGNFFKDKNVIQKLFSSSFIFNQPKDYLSGDFYWFGEKDGHKIIAVADCTGHGVPGALLTILGHRILDDLVMIQGIITPSKLLMELNKAVVAAFSNQKQVEYNIDVTIVSIKNNSNTLLFSGISNGLYYYSNNQLNYYKVTPKSLGSSLTIEDIKDQELHVTAGDTMYLCTDGFADQFGGSEKKKFNLKRMQELFSAIAKEKQFNASDATLEKEFTNWKGNNEQTDDVLIIGVKMN